MIINNVSILSKKQKKALLIISLIVDIIATLIFSSLIIITYKSNSEFFNNKYTAIVILTVLGTVPIGDMFYVFKKKKSYIFRIINAVSSKKTLLSKSNMSINSVQLKLCERISGSNDKTGLIYVYGKKNKGKTTGVIFLLESLLLNNNYIDNSNIINTFTYIDCTNEKQGIIDYFYINSNVLDRIKKFENKLVVIDNVECLGKAFLEDNINLFSSKKSVFIIVEDTNSDVGLLDDNDTNYALHICNFNKSVFSMIKSIDIKSMISNMNSHEKRVLYALYLFSISYSFVNKNVLSEILGYKKREFNKIYKIIQNKNLFVDFPFNDSYCFCYRKSELRNVNNITTIQDAEYSYVLDKFIKSDLLDSEIKWLCLIRSSFQKVSCYSNQYRLDLFYKALYNGDYKKLYDELAFATKDDERKGKLFLYEKAYLSFYLGKHLEASKIYRTMISNCSNANHKKTLMLHIIESSHGNPNSINMKMIGDFIKELKLHSDLFSVFAEYWEVHINSEKGIFNPSKLSKIRSKLQGNLQGIDNNTINIGNSIIQRTFTDEIRINHILGNNEMLRLYSEYVDFLNTCSDAMKEYYSNLYIEANHIHYILLLNSILNIEREEYDLEELIKTADEYYNKAINCSYADEKSRRAARVKQLDLCCFYNDFNVDEAVSQINVFRIHSQINSVGVHEAYCETLLMKMLIIDSCNIDNYNGFNFNESKMKDIYMHFQKSVEIYNAYGNEYGVFRSRFIILLFELLFSTKDSTEKVIKKLVDLIGNHINYSKEKMIVECLYRKIKEQSITKMQLISLIKAYPIILQ
ncbi:MAG: hypothetical protein K6F76_03575 [Clostridiales bacterium]|nr:hypothetical protein [Clostridiales bacterium]